MALSQDRAPDWRNELLIPDPKLWEAVALSLNIGPDKVRHRYEDITGSHFFNETQEFHDRLRVACENRAALVGEPSITFSLSPDAKVSLRRFAHWAIDVEWEVPPALADIVEANERSRANKEQDLARLFNEPNWHAKRVLAWIAFRDPGAIAASLNNARRYRYTGAPGQFPLRESKPEDVLLHAVRSGAIAGFENGRKRKPEDWATASGYDWPSDVRFRRADVLRLWPQEPDPASAKIEEQANAASETLFDGARKRASPVLENARAAVKAVCPEGAPTQAVLTNKALLKKANDWLKDNGRPSAKLDAVLRAAGRRK